MTVRRLANVSKAPNGVLAVENTLDEFGLLDYITEFSHGHALRPSDDLPSLRWLLTQLRKNTARGRLTGFLLESTEHRLIGTYLYYLSNSRIAEVIQLIANSEEANMIVQHLFYRAWKEGAVGVSGRFEPRLMPALWDHHCLVHRGCYALTHSTNPQCIDVINRGDAFLTALEGDLWLASPQSVF